MRHSCLFVAVSLSVLALGGCRVESSGRDESSAFNPADNVDLTFSTFDITNTKQAPAALSYTRFHDFYAGIEPADDANNPADADQLAAELRRHIDIFIGATPTDDGLAYNRLRNPLDLMHQIISVGRIDNFDEGRRYIRSRIAEGAAGGYNSRSAGARIRFTDQAGAINQQPLNAREWNYQTLDWRYQPPADNLAGKVYRTIQYVARTVDEADQEQQPPLLSLLAGSRFDAGSFSAVGYNQPEYATADFVSRNHGGIELRQEFVGETPKDTLYIKNSDQPVLDLGAYLGADADQSPDCLRIELDYAMSEVRLYSSNNEPAQVPDPDADPANDDADNDIPTVNNPDNCSHQAEGQALTRWSAAGSPNRQ